MRYLLHIGLFGLALTAVTQADAQDRRREDRHTTVVIARGGGPQVVRPVRASFDPPHVVYDQRRTFHPTPNPMHVARRDYFHQREDLEQIVRISRRWEQATANRNREAEWKVNRRLDAWLEREVRESRNERYTQRILSLSHELAALEQRRHYARRYNGRGHYDRGHHGRGHYARSYRGYYENKARILDTLIQLSERQVQRAEANLRYPYRPSFAYR